MDRISAKSVARALYKGLFKGHRDDYALMSFPEYRDTVIGDGVISTVTTAKAKWLRLPNEFPEAFIRQTNPKFMAVDIRNLAVIAGASLDADRIERDREREQEVIRW